MRVKLLNDGSYDGLKGIKFPVEVETCGHVGVGSLVLIAASELVRIGAKADYFCEDCNWIFVIGVDVEVIRDEPEGNPDWIPVEDAELEQLAVYWVKNQDGEVMSVPVRWTMGSFRADSWDIPKSMVSHVIKLQEPEA